MVPATTSAATGSMLLACFTPGRRSWAECSKKSAAGSCRSFLGAAGGSGITVRAGTVCKRDKKKVAGAFRLLPLFILFSVKTDYSWGSITTSTLLPPPMMTSFTNAARLSGVSALIIFL